MNFIFTALEPMYKSAMESEEARQQLQYFAMILENEQLYSVKNLYADYKNRGLPFRDVGRVMRRRRYRPRRNPYVYKKKEMLESVERIN